MRALEKKVYQAGVAQSHLDDDDGSGCQGREDLVSHAQDVTQGEQISDAPPFYEEKSIAATPLCCHVTSPPPCTDIYPTTFVDGGEKIASCSSRNIHPSPVPALRGAKSHAQQQKSALPTKKKKRSEAISVSVDQKVIVEAHFLRARVGLLLSIAGV